CPDDRTAEAGKIMDGKNAGTNPMQVDDIRIVLEYLTKGEVGRKIIAPMSFRPIPIEFEWKLVDIPHIAGGQFAERIGRAVNELVIRGTRVENHHVRIGAQLSEGLVQAKSSSPRSSACAHR
ncbi:MAG: hypothetical protein WAM85_17870, partial [Terracidiphilus sp.]